MLVHGQQLVQLALGAVELAIEPLYHPGGHAADAGPQQMEEHHALDGGRVQTQGRQQHGGGQHGQPAADQHQGQAGLGDQQAHQIEQRGGQDELGPAQQLAVDQAGEADAHQGVERVGQRHRQPPAGLEAQRAEHGPEQQIAQAQAQHLGGGRLDQPVAQQIEQGDQAADRIDEAQHRPGTQGQPVLVDGRDSAVGRGRGAVLHGRGRQAAR